MQISKNKSNHKVYFDKLTIFLDKNSILELCCFNLILLQIIMQYLCRIKKVVHIFVRNNNKKVS